MDFPRGFKTKANKIALTIREKMGLHPIDPIDPDAICALFDIRLTPLSEVAPGSPFLGPSRSAFSAVTVHRGLLTEIVHNDSHHPLRQRSNICHELSHGFLGHESTPPLTDTGERAHDSAIEREADFLAGTLLMPNEAAIYVVRNGLVGAAQGQWGVSQPMLQYRLRMSGAYRIHQRIQARA